MHQRAVGGEYRRGWGWGGKNGFFKTHKSANHKQILAGEDAASTAIEAAGADAVAGRPTTVPSTGESGAAPAEGKNNLMCTDNFL